MSVAMLRESTLLAVAVAVLAAAVSTHSPPYAMPFDYAVSGHGELCRRRRRRY